MSSNVHWSINAQLESLEQRRLLSISLVHGQVRVIGDDAPNRIVIERNRRAPSAKYTVALDDTAVAFRIGDVKSFRIRSAGGEDTIIINAAMGSIR